MSSYLISLESLEDDRYSSNLENDAEDILTTQTQLGQDISALEEALELVEDIKPEIEKGNATINAIEGNAGSDDNEAEVEFDSDDVTQNAEVVEEAANRKELVAEAFYVRVFPELRSKMGSARETVMRALGKESYGASAYERYKLTHEGLVGTLKAIYIKIRDFIKNILKSIPRAFAALGHKLQHDVFYKKVSKQLDEWEKNKNKIIDSWKKQTYTINQFRNHFDSYLRFFVSCNGDAFEAISNADIKSLIKNPKTAVIKSLVESRAGKRIKTIDLKEGHTLVGCQIVGLNFKVLARKPDGNLIRYNKPRYMVMFPEPDMKDFIEAFESLLNAHKKGYSGKFKEIMSIVKETERDLSKKEQELAKGESSDVTIDDIKNIGVIVSFLADMAYGIVGLNASYFYICRKLVKVFGDGESKLDLSIKI